VGNHPFLDGNKRVGHAALEVFLLLNGHEIKATVDEQEKIILDLAGGTVERDQWLAWIQHHIHRVQA
jgi:death-on-curing protein